ncbi:MAG: MogA/MoaB family molybdenum cofactor biosynthesis protein, partial [Deltaproteobacteria bacterium]|nr:MogA/MoaB family molybdenum cofactor biosynthesis protein [Deltaproteobacteria bacterium]
EKLSVSVLTVSDTRGLEDDLGGALIVELLTGAGHSIAERIIVKDDIPEIQAAVQKALASGEADAIVLTGGTGVAPRDVTPDALAPILERELPGFGELFRMLSYEEIGTPAMLSRAMAGVIGETLVFALPGSRGAIRTAVERIILPELGHLVSLANPQKAKHSHKPDKA